MPEASTTPTISKSLPDPHVRGPNQFGCLHDVGKLVIAPAVTRADQSQLVARPRLRQLPMQCAQDYRADLGMGRRSLHYIPDGTTVWANVRPRHWPHPESVERPHRRRAVRSRDVWCCPGRCVHGPLRLRAAAATAAVVSVRATQFRRPHDHAQASILRFVEDNWSLGRLGDQSFDARDASLAGLFDFEGRNQRLMLDPSTGQPNRN